MKRTFFITVLTLIFALSLTACGTGNGNNNNNNSDNIISDIQSGTQRIEDGVESGMDSLDTKISREKAKEIAITHAKVNENDIRNYRIKLENDGGVMEYDIEFDCNDREYDYEIDANTGEIRESSTNLDIRH